MIENDSNSNDQKTLKNSSPKLHAFNNIIFKKKTLIFSLFKTRLDLGLAYYCIKNPFSDTVALFLDIF